MKKNYSCIIFLFIAVQVSSLYAQTDTSLSAIGIHYSLTDFETAHSIYLSSAGHVLNNKQWAHPPQMMTGIGVDYQHYITKHLNVVTSFNYTKGVNNYKLPLTNTISYSLLTFDAVANVQMLSDKYSVRPYLIAGVGIYTQHGTGFYAPMGGGFQFNIFKSALVNIQSQFRGPFSKKDYGNFYYQFGLATAIQQKKTKPLTATLLPVIKDTIKLQSVVEQSKNLYRDIIVLVLDETTQLPLQYAKVSISNRDSAVQTAMTDATGKTIFANTLANDYSITATLNGIASTTKTVKRNSFDTTTQMIVTLTHNDPRFTLSGRVMDKKTSAGIGGALVTVTNNTHDPISQVKSNNIDGSFTVQLEAESDFTISGKKENYISNIENISTKGLNRSTILYVNLQLIVEEAKVGQTIVLNKIFFETGKSVLNVQSSSDLDKLILFLKDNPTVKLEIKGHTDNTGTVAVNNALSNARALSVANYLMKNGIQKERLLAKGYGSSQPIADNRTIEGRAQNRRVEVVIEK